jgi:integrase/recombinase XerD
MGIDTRNLHAHHGGHECNYTAKKEPPAMSHDPRHPPTPRIRTLASEVAAFLDDAEDRRHLSPNTLTAYRSDLHTAMRTLTAPLHTISLVDIEAFLVGRTESPATTNRRIASLRQFFRWSQRQGYRTDNPVDLVEPIRSDDDLPRPIKRGDLPALDKAIAAAPPPYRLMFTILRETGMQTKWWESMSMR